MGCPESTVLCAEQTKLLHKFSVAGLAAGCACMNLAKRIFLTLRGVAMHPANRRAPASAILRFCATQVAVRRIPGDVCVPFVGDTSLLVPLQMRGSTHLIDPVLCEFEEMAFTMHFLRGSDLFVDVGANIGAFTVLASGVSQARTIAFEPHNKTFLYLKRNVALNFLQERCRTVQCALGRGTGELRLTSGLGMENYVATGKEDSISVPCRRIDDELKREAPALIKVDVEGFEADVIAGGQSTLQAETLQAMIVERTGIGNRYGFDEDVLHAQIRELGFAPFRYDPFARELQQIGEREHGNIVYVRRGKLPQVENRLREAPKVKFRLLEF